MFTAVLASCDNKAQVKNKVSDKESLSCFCSKKIFKDFILNLNHKAIKLNLPANRSLWKSINDVKGTNEFKTEWRE